MFRLAYPEYLHLLFLTGLFVILFAVMQQWKKRSLKKLGEVSLLQKLFPEASVYKPLLKFILAMAAFVFLVFGIVNPQVGSKLEEVKRKGVDVMIALDVSNSMKAEDIRPNRLERSKQAISRLVDQLQGDRIGLIVFAGKAYVQLPITTDYGAAKLFLSSVSTDMIPLQGTSIGPAIDLAINSFSDSLKKNNAIVIISDGEDHEGAAVDAAKYASEKGIVVHTVGMGSPDGAPVPVYSNGVRVGFKQDKEGNTVISKLNDAALSAVADAGKGKYVRASNSDDGLSLIMKEIDKMEKKEFGAKVYTDYEDQFQYFLAMALILLLAEFMVSERKSRWIEKLNLFGKRNG